LEMGIRAMCGWNSPAACHPWTFLRYGQWSVSTVSGHCRMSIRVTRFQSSSGSTISVSWVHLLLSDPVDGEYWGNDKYRNSTQFIAKHGVSEYDTVILEIILLANGRGR